MFEDLKLKNWKQTYWNQINRNIGLIKIMEQELIRTTDIAILGVGGLGGSIAEQLIRSGCENLIICDNDTFEESNLNRQICTREDIGKYKVDVIEELLKKINPDVHIKKYYEIDEKNISAILKNIKIAALTLDDPIISILVSRECLNLKIPMVETWGIPYLCAWWFTLDSINYETCYGLKTQNMTIEEIKKSNKVIVKIKKALFLKITSFPNILETYEREKGTIKGMLNGKLAFVSLAPIVSLSASYLAFEIIYSGILRIKNKILAPNVIGYDYLRMKPIEFFIK